MKDLFQREFGHRKFIIGCVHVLPLPGSPSYDRAAGMRPIIARAAAEARMLEDAGFHGILYVNEFDMPYVMTVPTETVAAMTALVCEAQYGLTLPHGLNVLLDPPASVAVCHATGGRFLRGYVTGAMAGDYGVWTGQGAKTIKLRHDLDAPSIKIIANVNPGFSDSLDRRPITDLAKGAVFSGKADALCITGGMAGTQTPVAALREVATAVPDTPVVAGTGTSEENIAATLEACDGVIVATSVKHGHKLHEPIDPVLAKHFMDRIRSLGY